MTRTPGEFAPRFRLEGRVTGSVGADRSANHRLLLKRRAQDPIDLQASGYALLEESGSVHQVAGEPWAALASMIWSEWPFPHAWCDQLFSTAALNELLAWLEGLDGWNETDGGFYQAGERALSPLPCPTSLVPFFGERGLVSLEEQATRLFGTAMRVHPPIAAHRMQEGQGVGAHSDKPHPGEETHRIILTLTRPIQWLRDGGCFLLFEHDRQPSAARVFARCHGAAVAFPMSEGSSHAVSIVNRGVRYSIVISFRAAG